MVLTEIQELKDIRVPGLQVDSKRTRTLVTTLVDISGGVVVHPQHGDDTVRRTVGTANVRTSRTDAVDVQTNTTSGLGDHCTCLQSVVDTLDTVCLHVDKEARGQLWLRGTSIEQSRRSVREVFLRHQVVGLNGLLDIRAVDSNSNTHQQVLRALSNVAIDPQQI